MKKSVEACSKVREQISRWCSIHDPISLSSDKSFVLLKLVVKWRCLIAGSTHPHWVMRVAWPRSRTRHLSFSFSFFLRYPAGQTVLGANYCRNESGMLNFLIVYLSACETMKENVIRVFILITDPGRIVNFLGNRISRFAHVLLCLYLLMNIEVDT